MAAPKEATVYIVDVGKSMGRKEQDREETNLEWSMQYVWDRIATTVMSAKKTHTLGVIALRSDETSNELADKGEEGYENVKTIQEIQQTFLEDLKSLKRAIKPSRTNDGDLLSALALAIQMMESFTRKLKYIRRIVLVTDGRGSIADIEQADAFAAKLKADNVELTVLGVDFDDAEYGFKEEDKDERKAENESLLKKLCDDSDGLFGTIAYAISEMGIPRITQPNPMHSYKGYLTLGDPVKYETAMSIAVERYPKVRIAKAPTASSYVVKSENSAAGPSSTQTSATMQGDGHENTNGDGGLTGVKMARTYEVKDDSAPGGIRELESDELARGYTYGRTAVPMEKADEHVTKLETTASFDVVGFVAKEEYQHYFGMSETNQIIGSRINQKFCMALSSFIHALHERDSYAVARLVSKDKKDPVMVLLAPYFDASLGYECLIDVELPFAEDVRSFTFPPLDKVVTVGGKKITQHRNLPNEELMKAMSDYVDAMDLSTFDQDEDGEPKEYAAIEDTYNMRKNTIDQAVKFRGVNPHDPPPPPFEILSKYSVPPKHLLEQAQPALDGVIKAADVKKVPPKQKGRKRGRDQPKPLSGLDVGQLLGSQKRVKITTDNAVPEFKQILAKTDDMGQVKDAVKQLGAIIQDIVKNSTGNHAYQRAVEAMRVMKEEMSEMEEPKLYNAFLKEFKKKLTAGDLGGDRNEMWYLVKVSRLGLVDNAANDLSDVTPEEARAFLSLK